MGKFIKKFIVCLVKMYVKISLERTDISSDIDLGITRIGMVVELTGLNDFTQILCVKLKRKPRT